MNELIAALQAIPEGEAWRVSLSGEEYVLCNFDHVDPTIYNQDDMVMARIVKNPAGNRIASEGTLIQFAASQIQYVKNLSGELVLYDREN